MKQSKIYYLILSALFLALGIILPFFTAQVPVIGKALLPMHIPVLICGFFCGWQYGLLVGAVTPIVRSLMYTMPPLFPTAAAMAFELAAYGGICGFLYSRMKHSKAGIYGALIGAMIGGRIVWGCVMMIFAGIGKASFGFQAFLAGAFLNAVPGIVIQLILIPALVIVLKPAGEQQRRNR